MRNAQEVGDRPSRSPDLPKRGNLKGTIACRERGELRNRLAGRRSETWTVWVRLNCLKSSGELETGPPLTQRLRSSPISSVLITPRREISLMGTRSMRPIKPRTDALTRPNVTYDRTTGSPKGCEPYGDGASIVVVGVTTHHGGWTISQLQGQGGQDLGNEKKERYA